MRRIVSKAIELTAMLIGASIVSCGAMGLGVFVLIVAEHLLAGGAK